MVKKLLIIIAALVIVLGGGATAYYFTNSSYSTPNESKSASQNNSDKPAFNAVSTSGQSFVAKMTTTSDSSSTTATIYSDGKGNTRYQTIFDGQESNMYTTADEVISCHDDKCYKLPQNSSAEIQSDNYEYDESDINKFKSSAIYKGKSDCPAGSCNVWEVDDKDTEYKTEVYLDSKGRPSKLTSDGKDGNIEITYEYKAVTIDIPTNTIAGDD